MDPFSVSTGLAGFLSLTIEITKVLKEYIGNVKSAKEDALTLSTELASLGFVLNQLVKFLRSNDSDLQGTCFDQTSVLHSVIAICKDKLEHVYKRLEKFHKAVTAGKLHGLFERLKWPFEKEECESAIKTLRSCSQIFSFSLSVANW